MPTFWGLDATGWTAVTALATVALVLATIALAVVTIVLVCVAGNQIKALRQSNKQQLEFLRHENIQSRTLAACERYDLDPVLEKAVRKVRQGKASGELDRFPNPYRNEIYTIMNFLEQLAIGAKRGVYDERILRDYMEYIATEHIEDLMGPYNKLEPIEEDVEQDDVYSEIQALCQKWALEKESKSEAAT